MRRSGLAGLLLVLAAAAGLAVPAVAQTTTTVDAVLYAKGFALLALLIVTVIAFALGFLVELNKWLKQPQAANIGPVITRGIVVVALVVIFSFLYKQWTAGGEDPLAFIITKILGWLGI